MARVDPGVVKYEATFFYDIRYSGVKNLRIDLPAELAAEIRNNTPGISEKLLDPQPDDVAKENVAWGFSGERTARPDHDPAVLGTTADNLEVGQSLDLELPHLEPLGPTAPGVRSSWSSPRRSTCWPAARPKACGRSIRSTT